MLDGWINLVVWKFNFFLLQQKITNSNFLLYTGNFDEFFVTKIKIQLKEMLGLSDITPKHLQNHIVGPRIIQAYKKLTLENSSTDGYIILLLGYSRSPSRDNESYLRIVVDLDEDDGYL